MNRSLPSIVTVTLLVVCLGLTVACWKSDDEPAAIVESGIPSGESVDLEREDMAALPGADVDLVNFKQFPDLLRQESTLTSQAIYSYYDKFFVDRGWKLESSIDPIMGAEVRRYQFGDELAFLTVTEIGPGRNEVILARRTLREDEKIPSGS